MRVLIAGFVTIDTIVLPVRTINSVGGPPSYAGLICSRFGLDVFPLTKIGSDFPDESTVWLARNGLRFRAVDKSKLKKTTRFRIVQDGGKRDLKLLERCEDIAKEQVPQERFNASLISPIANEISMDILDDLSNRSDFCFLDPQGFVRSFDGSGKVSLREWNNDRALAKIDALKMDRDEAEMITGKVEAMDALTKVSSKGMRKALVTQGGERCYVLDGTRILQVQVPKARVVDSTGAGDILSGALVTAFLRTRDFVWSCCFGIAASSLSMNSIALSKVDLPRSVDEQARRLYSLARVVATA